MRPNASEVLRAKYRRRDGSVTPVEITRRILHGEDGVYVVATVRDIAERKRAKKRLALHAQRQESIARFGQLALGCTDLDRLYEFSLDQLSQANLMRTPNGVTNTLQVMRTLQEGWNGVITG